MTGPAATSSRYWVRRVVALALLLAALFMVVLLFQGSCDSCQEGEATIFIDSGSTTSDIARQLVAEGVITNEKEFEDKAAELGVDEDLKPGTYLLQKCAPIEDILRILVRGLQAPEGVLTIPEGLRISEIAVLVSEKTGIDREEYIAATLVDGRQLPLTGTETAADLEGFLFPSTYDLEPGIQADGIVEMQLAAFVDMAGVEDWSNAEALGLTQYEALIVASIIEREAIVDEERPLVAAVIYNRLAEGMKLEVDATVQYALGSWKTDLTVEELAVDSFYNTRLYGGLPPGPISNPGVESIRAALNPADVDYLYYVATGDVAGTHFFTRSYEEFLQMKNS